jgi:hypothetical protein
LDHHPVCHALSNAWSDDVSNNLLPEEITVDGKQLMVGPNLAVAFQPRGPERGVILELA